MAHKLTSETIDSAEALRAFLGTPSPHGEILREIIGQKYVLNSPYPYS